MTRVLVTRPLPAEVIDALPSGLEVEKRAANTPLAPAELGRALTDFDIVLTTLGDAFSAEVFSGLPGPPRCRLLANFGAGTEHIDTAAAGRVGIAVTNTPGAVAEATADIALTLILMVARRAGEGDRLVRAGRWEGWHPTQLLGMHLGGKRVGIAGMGNIGQALARRCHFGLGMDVHYWSRSPRTLPYPAVRHARLSELAAAVDVLVAAVPGGAETRHLFDARIFAAMRRSAIFVNIARGSVHDEAALVAALSSGQIAGAGLDVHEFEPRVPEALRAMENVVLLPHLGTAAHEVRVAMGLMAVENIRAHLEGRPLPNPVLPAGAGRGPEPRA